MQEVRGLSACACPVVCYILHVRFLGAALSMPRAISLQLSVLDPGEGLPLFLVQTEVQTTEKKFLGDRFLPTPAPPPYLKVWIWHWLLTLFKSKKMPQIFHMSTHALCT